MTNKTLFSGYVQIPHAIEPVADLNVRKPHASPVQEASEREGDSTAAKTVGSPPKPLPLLTTLPAELKSATMCKVLDYPGTQAGVEGITALRLVSASLREALEADAVLCALYQQVKKEVEQISKCANTFSVRELIRSSHKALFATASRRKQKTYVAFVLNEERLESAKHSFRTKGIWVNHPIELIGGLLSLEDFPRQRVIEAALSVDGDSARMTCEIVTEWGPNLKFLTRTIAVLGSVLKQPTSPQHMECNERLFYVFAVQLISSRALAWMCWTHIGVSLHALTPQQHKRLFEIALRLSGEGERNRALYGLIAGLSALSPELKETWLRHYLGDVEGSEFSLTQTNRRLGSSISAFNHIQQTMHRRCRPEGRRPESEGYSDCRTMPCQQPQAAQSAAENCLEFDGGLR